MYEIRIHGRGGQGAVLLSKILAKALVTEGKFVSAIPSFGFERRGAPVAAFMRYSDKEIRSVTNIYNPDCIICIDPTVANAVDVFAGKNDQGTLVQATQKGIDQLDLPPTLAKAGLCDAVGIAMGIFRRPITNTVMLGAFAKTTGIVSLESLKDGLSTANFRDAGLAQNMEAIERGFEETAVHELGTAIPAQTTAAAQTAGDTA